MTPERRRQPEPIQGQERTPLALGDTPIDAYLLVLALVVALAIGFLHPGKDGRIAELIVVAVAAAWAYLVGVRAARLVAFAALSAYLALEGHYDRLNGDYAWQELLALGAIIAVVMASGALRGELERLRARVRALGDELEVIESERTLEAKLAGGKPMTQLEYELERSRRHNHEVCLILLRPDGFDEIGLRFGESAAELTLERIAETIGSSLRATDIPLRQGPFDFAVILPETSIEAARALAERTRLAIGSIRLELDPGEEIELSVSIGIASFPADATANDELVAAAQRALSAASEQGGNRTVLHSLPADAPAGWGIGRREQ
jgi:diguanylate cyclase (GGDEF)-like protein